MECHRGRGTVEECWSIFRVHAYPDPHQAFRPSKGGIVHPPGFSPFPQPPTRQCQRQIPGSYIKPCSAETSDAGPSATGSRTGISDPAGPFSGRQQQPASQLRVANGCGDAGMPAREAPRRASRHLYGPCPGRILPFTCWNWPHLLCGCVILFSGRKRCADLQVVPRDQAGLGFLATRAPVCLPRSHSMCRDVPRQEFSSLYVE